MSRVVIGCVLVLLAADSASAQTLTANGNTDPFEIYRGDTVTISTTGASTDWVGLYVAGSSGSYLDWFYVNGSKSSSAPSTPITFTVQQAAGAYEFRKYTYAPYQLLATSAVVTVQPGLFEVNGAVAPQAVVTELRATMQVDVRGSFGCTTDWVGLYRPGTTANGAWLDWVYLNGMRTAPSTAIQTASFTMKVPNVRGPYELRLFYCGGYDIRATSATIHAEARTLAAGGDAHTLVARSDGTLWASGLNASGQLGDDSTIDQTTPIQVPGVSIVVSVAAGASHSLALTATGSLYVWGANDAGQVGDGTNTQRLTPTLLSLTDVVAIAAGEHHSVALTAAGQLYTWGLNSSGALGNGTTTNSNAPVQVATDVIAIGAGDRFTLFVTSDSVVWGMGTNEFGQLAGGTGTNQLSPTQMGANPAVAVSGGRHHSLALRSDGTVLATGLNTSGQTGQSAYCSSWCVVPTLTNIVGIAAGDDFSLALDKDGVLWGWGDNSAGQLGTATPSQRTLPEAITGLSGARFVAAGNAHVIALDADNMVMTFGENTAGGLGDGTTTNRATPEPNYDFSGRVATPTFSVSSGSYGSDFTVVVSNATGGSTMHYTQNGSEPTTSDPTIASGSSIAIAQSQTLKVTAWKPGTPSSDVGSAVYEMKVATPSLSPGAGTFSSPTSVTLATSTSSAEVRYTLDGSDPTSSSAQYTSPVLVDHTSTLKVAGFKSNWSDSNINTGIYTMNFGTLVAPAVEPAAGTYTSAVTVTMSSAQPGATIRLTTNGDTPTASSAAYTAPLSLDGSMTLKAKAFHPDYTTSTETTRIYALAAAAPTIDPPTGVYTSAQNVTITAPSEPSVTVRYTLDGAEPTETSTAYTAAFAVETGTTIKARSFPNNGWAVSDPALAVLSFNYGTLAAPIASPDGGVYAAAQVVTLSAAAGATIHYTTDGTDPTPASNAYNNPVQLPSETVTLKARAFQQDWTASAALSETFAVDTTAPTITAHHLPATINEWSRTPVTVSFHCVDDVQVASCSPPVTLSQEGAGQTATGTAVDTAGTQTQLPVTLNLDFAPPTVSVSSPISGLVTTNATLAITGQVADALSGLAAVTCNGAAANVVDGAVSCSVTLRPGRNVVVVAAGDVAGNSASSGLTVTLTGTVTQLTMTPDQRTMLVGETGTLSLRDNFGVAPTNPTWATTNPAVVSLSADGPPVLTAVAVGTATISASENGLTAWAQVTVAAGETLPSGEVRLPAGTTRWNLPTVTSSQSRRTAPIYANRIEEEGPYLFTAEPNSTTNEYTVRAVSGRGDVLWKEAAPGLPLMGDSYGALIAGVEGDYRCALYFGEDRFCFKALVRFGGSETALPWRYESAGYIDRPSQAPDGTIYAIEHINGARNLGITPDLGNNKSVVVLDGSTGEVKARVTLPPYTYRDDCGITYNEPKTLGPIVASDGYAYVLAERRDTVASGPCSGAVLVSTDQSWTLYRLSQAGQVASVIVDQCQTSSCGTFIDPQQLIPDSVDGVLVNTKRFTSQSQNQLEGRLIRFGPEWERTDHTFPSLVRIDLVGEDGLVYLQTSSSGNATTQAFNVLSGTAAWSATPALTLVAARKDGGATAQASTGELLRINANGEVAETLPILLTDPFQLGSGWMGNTPGALKAVAAADVPTATTWDATRVAVGILFEPRGFGYQSGQSAPRKLCALCTKDYIAPDGHGPASATDIRRVITVVIDSSWEDAPGEPNARILEATACAINEWNNATDLWGNKNGFFLYLNQEAVYPGVPDVMIVKNSPCPLNAYACIDNIAYPDFRPPSVATLIPTNTTLTTVRDADLCGRVAHELAHKFGAHGSSQCNMVQNPSILDGAYHVGPRTGQRDINSVTVLDVELVNQALVYPQTCTATGLTPHEPVRQQ